MQHQCECCDLRIDVHGYEDVLYIKLSLYVIKIGILYAFPISLGVTDYERLTKIK